MSISEYFRREEERAARPHPRVVAFAANGRGVGKTYVTTRLECALAARGHKAVRLSMADRLREIVALFSKRFDYPLSLEALSDGKDKPLALYGWDGFRNKTGRDLLIAFGETMVDVLGPYFWANIWRKRAEDAIKRGYVVICDDVRRQSELETVKSLGGIVIYLNSRWAERGELEGLISPSDCDMTFDYDRSEYWLANVLEYILERFADR